MKKYIIISILILMYSCTTLKTPSSINNIQKINENNYKLINGSYSIYSVDSSYRTLEDILFNKKGKNNFENLPDSTLKINLELINCNKLKVSLLKDNDTINSKIKRGYINDGYFEINRSIVGSFDLIFNSLGEQISRIGLLKNNNITIDTYDGGVVFLVVIPLGGVDSELYNLEFERKK